MAGNGTDRLESWKEIAAFIRKDERTAMRWAKKLGMPVQRNPAEKRGRVFASRAEISHWLARQACPVAESLIESATGTPQKKPLWKRYALYGAVGAFAILTLFFVFRPTSGGAGVAERVVFEGDTLQALDARGHVIWAHKFPKSPDTSSLAGIGTLNDFVRIADLNEDADREILVVVPFRVGLNPEDWYQTEVDCFSSQGKLLWSYVPQETFQFGEHELRGPWQVFDVFVSQVGPKAAIWVSFGHGVWGNSFVAQLDAKTGHVTVRFVNTGTIYKLNEVKTMRGNYLLVGGFNNEYEAGSLAVIDEKRPFAASPQTAGTRHKCVSCPEGSPDYYFVFPRSEINQLLELHEDPVRGVTVSAKEIDISKAEKQTLGGVRTIYQIRVEPNIAAVSMRYDSSYDMLHRAWSAEGKLSHSLENCPERLHPQPVRLWTPSSGWSDLGIKPAKANQ